MGLQIIHEIESVEFWKYIPSALERTKPRRLAVRPFVTAVQNALMSGLDELDFYIESPDKPCYIVKLHFSKNRSLAVKVSGNVIMTDKHCYSAKTKTLWNLLETKAYKNRVKVRVPQTACFVRGE